MALCFAFAVAGAALSWSCARAINVPCMPLGKASADANLTEIRTFLLDVATIQDTKGAADLVEAATATVPLKSPLTILAPTNEAFANITDFASTLSPQQVLEVLQYHVLPEELNSTELRAAISDAPGNETDLDTLLGPKVEAMYTGRDLMLQPRGSEQASKVVEADIYTCAGVVHVIDRVMIPVKGTGGRARFEELVGKAKEQVEGQIVRNASKGDDRELDAGGNMRMEYASEDTEAVVEGPPKASGTQAIHKGGHSRAANNGGKAVAYKNTSMQPAVVGAATGRVEHMQKTKKGGSRDMKPDGVMTGRLGGAGSEPEPEKVPKDTIPRKDEPEKRAREGQKLPEAAKKDESAATVGDDAERAASHRAAYEASYIMGRHHGHFASASARSWSWRGGDLFKWQSGSK